MVRFDVGPSRPPIVLPPDHPPVIGLEQCPVSDSARSKYLSAATASSSSSTPESSNSRYTKKLYDDLSKDRVVSSIPRAPIGLPSVHLGSSEGSGSEDDPNWVYPSEYQFFNAMSRKSHKPKAADMPNVVAIHNAVNEKAWEEVLKWEVGMGSEPCGGPKLVSFAGIPTKRTPRALVNIALGYSPPFDRHDWFIDRCGHQIRYVLDFYTGRQDKDHPDKMAFFLDVRPALDSRIGIETRLKGIWRSWFG